MLVAYMMVYRNKHLHICEQKFKLFIIAKYIDQHDYKF